MTRVEPRLQRAVAPDGGPGEPGILFRVAAGPRIGFGHLVRAARLARALSLHHPVVSVRGTRVAPDVVTTLGLTHVAGGFDAACTRFRPSVVVVDDPNPRAARLAVARARRRGLVTISVHDLGIAHAGADYGIDGSVAPGKRKPGKIASLMGPTFSVIDPGCAAPPRRCRRPVVVIALGGGPRDRLAFRLAEAIAARTRGVDVVVARGFTAAAPGSLPPPISCVTATAGLADLFRQARAAVTAGGLTLAEAAACATPVVATAVVDAQRPSILAFARHGAAVDGGRLAGAAIPGLADEVAALLADPARCARMGSAGRRIVDGHGARRAATAIRKWLATRARGDR